jgi:hypothetical protein
MVSRHRSTGIMFALMHRLEMYIKPKYGMASGDLA